MKSKILSLFSLSILALVMVAGMASASTISEWALNSTDLGSAINVNTNVVPGTFTSSGVTILTFDDTKGASSTGWETLNEVNTAKYYEVTISPKAGYSLTLSDVNFGYSSSVATLSSFELQYSKSVDFASPISIVTKADVNNAVEKDSSTTGLNINVYSGETLTLRWFGYHLASDANTFFINDLILGGTLVQTPTEIQTCSALSGVSGDLSVQIKDITVISGFGDDEKFWYPLDEIEVEVKVENNGDYDIDNIEIEWGLYDVDADDWLIDDKENDFNLKDGDDNTIYLTFKLENVDDFTKSDYVFYVWANGDVDDDANTKICASNSKKIEIVNDDNFVILDNVQFPETASCGSEIQITADVWNVGDSDQDEVKVIISNTELKINKIVEIGDIKDLDSEILDTLIEIPSDVEEKVYVFTLKVYDEDNDVFETDEDGDESKFLIRVSVEGCSVSSNALVSANLVSGGKAGENLVVKATITNSGTKSADYTINAAGYAEWADSASIDQSVFTLNTGSSKEVLITLAVNKDAVGQKQFNIEVLSENALVATQPVQVEIQGTSSGFAGITGNIFADGNKYLWGIGILNVILIIFIIIVAVRVARK